MPNYMTRNALQCNNFLNILFSYISKSKLHVTHSFRGVSIALNLKIYPFCFIKMLLQYKQSIIVYHYNRSMCKLVVLYFALQ